MKTRIFNRTLGVLLSVLLLVISIPAQDALGPSKLLAPPAPTLGGTTSLGRVFRAGRPMLGYVGRIGGVAFDGVASPSEGLKVNNLTLAYAATRPDGNRLVLGINGESVETSLYDWQLIPVAKFANSDDPSCVTLFGHLDNPQEEDEIIEQLPWRSITRFPNYHPSFNNTLMGLRLFQLDSLIINSFSYDLPTEKGEYILGAGEAIKKEENERNYKEFRKYSDQNEALFDSYTSYLISDHDREITFDITGGKLMVRGEPSYYFWYIDDDQYEELRHGYLLEREKDGVLAELRRIRPLNSVRAKRTWLAGQLRKGIVHYLTQIDEDLTVDFLGYREFLDLVRQDATSRERSLNEQSVPWLTDRLAELRTIETMPVPSEVPELSKMLSTDTQIVRAINPAVWDAGATVMRYAGFFHYVKKEYPQAWKAFMAQIERAPAPRPPVKTPTVFNTPLPTQ